MYFGHKAAEPFERLKRARHAVWVATTMLIRTAGEHGMDNDRNRKLKEQWCSQIWEGYGAAEQQPDELTDAVSRAVVDIEAMCRPHLKL